jgi:hypothetical protein
MNLIELGKRQELYDNIQKVESLPTRRILYIQFVSMYYREAFNCLVGEVSPYEAFKQTDNSHYQNIKDGGK